jgi:hypothetical protein
MQKNSANLVGIFGFLYWRTLLTNLMLMKNNRVVSKMFKLQELNGRDNFLYVVFLLENTKTKGKHRIVFINLFQIVIAAFIDEYDVIAVGHRGTQLPRWMQQR